MSVDDLKVSAATSARGFSSLSLLAPFIRPDLGAGESARGADTLLLVERDLSAATASGVSLGVSLSERLSTLGLCLIKEAIKK